MYAYSTPSLPRPGSSGGSIGSISHSNALNSPTAIRAKAKRRPSDEISGTEGDEDVAHASKRRYSGVKRACNECRQQKVRAYSGAAEQHVHMLMVRKLKCNVTTEPIYIDCERCRRLKLSCKIDTNFKRIGKRSRNAQMEREITELRDQVAALTQQTRTVAAAAPLIKTSNESLVLPPLNLTPPGNPDMESGEAVASLMDLATGAEAGSFLRSPSAILLFSRCLGEVHIAQDQIQALFQM